MVHSRSLGILLALLALPLAGSYGQALGRVGMGCWGSGLLGTGDRGGVQGGWKCG